ncbi:1-acyl-sn-glycerol-3-phosphate acyltransferase [Anatilimnocola aggregata]|uniref:1-acyl-sn-glycerol-3-phosphate acyltransferase n=1 Tax=Anatilimnocola aggregata TaxID=2528021 RepID=A0A517Y7A8_9BACT|nr:1-acyl-sn-glycerol-3-phosphate acyltransferase [Anatilimnocola aggregata]QDU26022.1 1-acyl-sn-glycerol-3-phosphate acyltransferase [Anatilimnocola aggregata]
MTALQWILIALGVLVTAFVGWLIYLRLFSRFAPHQAVFWGVCYLFARWQWRAKLPPKLPIPEETGAVIVCNHRSSVDPFFVQTACHRKIYWMVAREYCVHPIFGLFLKLCEVIPVGRGGIDTAATKIAMRHAAKGGIVGMFPEGRINMTEQILLPCRPGAAVVAMNSRVPLLPVFIQGSPYRNAAWSPFLMRANVVVRVGPLLDISEYYGREDDPEAVQLVMLRVLKALAALAGQPDFEPQLAGRNWKPTDAQITADFEAAEERRKSK